MDVRPIKESEKSAAAIAARAAGDGGAASPAGSARTASDTRPVRVRNVSLDCLRVGAFALIVLLHVFTPTGTVSEVCVVASRVGVPLFFAITGYFSVGAAPAKLALRFRKVAKMTAAAVAVYVVAGLAGVYDWSGAGQGVAAYFSGDWLGGFLLFNTFDFAFPLWYLFALLYVYVVLMAWRALKLRDAWFVAIGLAVLAARFACYEFSDAAEAFPPQAGRSWIGMGIPGFALGMLVRMQAPRLARVPAPVIAAGVLAGLACSWLEMRHFGYQEIYLGSVLMVLCLFAGVLRWPRPFSAGGPAWAARAVERASRLGDMPSSVAYIVHLLFVGWLWTALPALGVTSYVQWAVWACTVAASLASGVAFTKALDAWKRWRARG